VPNLAVVEATAAWRAGLSVEVALVDFAGASWADDLMTDATKVATASKNSLDLIIVRKSKAEQGTSNVPHRLRNVKII
jgi:hypothetical protein